MWWTGEGLYECWTTCIWLLCLEHDTTLPLTPWSLQNPACSESWVPVSNRLQLAALNFGGARETFLVLSPTWGFCTGSASSLKRFSFYLFTCLVSPHSLGLVLNICSSERPSMATSLEDLHWRLPSGAAPVYFLQSTDHSLKIFWLSIHLFVHYLSSVV